MPPEFINYILEENGGMRTMVFKDSYFCIHPIVSKGCQDKIFLFRSRIGLWKSLIDYFLKGTCMEHPVKFVEINFAFFSSALQQNSRVHPVSHTWDLTQTYSVKIFLPFCVQIFLSVITKYFCPSVHLTFNAFSAFNKMRTIC